MRQTRNTTPADAKARSLHLIAAALAGAIDLQGHARHAHWNVTGPAFIALHELFGQIAESFDEYIDALAERAVQLGGRADGTIRAAAASTSLPLFKADVEGWRALCEQLALSLAAFSTLLRDGINAAADDPNTADLLTEVSRDVEKHLWLVESHLNG